MRISDWSSDVCSSDLKPVTYPASFWPLGEQTYDQSVAAGAQTLRTEVNAFHAQCPGSEIVVTGYSQGARIAGDVLGDIARDGSIPQSQVEGVLYADPRNSAGGIETVVDRKSTRLNSSH